MGFLDRAVLRALKSLPHPGGGAGASFLGWGGTIIDQRSLRMPGERNWSSSVGDGSGTQLVVSAISWLARELALAPMVVLEHSDDESELRVPRPRHRHDLVRLLRFPSADLNNPREPRGRRVWGALLEATIADLVVDGNAFWIKRRDTLGRVRQVWWVPHTMLTPRWEDGVGKPFIDHYEYRPGGSTIVEIPTHNVVHHAVGIDPQNTRRGLSRIRALLRELYTDEEAAVFTATVLSNLGLPGMVIIPGEHTTIDEPGAEEIKARFRQTYSGDRRGDPIVLSAKGDVKSIGWSPQELELSQIRDVPEERLTAALGIPAPVLGLGAGAQAVKGTATMRELRAQAWEGAVMPLGGTIAEGVNAMLLSDFVEPDDLDRVEFGFDWASVPVMLDMRLRLMQTVSTGVRSGVLQVDEGRVSLGYAPVGGADGGFQRSPGVGVDIGDEPSAPTDRDDDEEVGDDEMQTRTRRNRVRRAS